MRARAALLLLAAACGMHDGGGSADVAAFRAAAEKIDARAASYGVAAAAATDGAGCLATHAGYDADVRPMVEAMRDLADAMDAQMAAACDAGAADMACGADAMRAELDRHHAAACASEADPAANAAEAAAHVGSMRRWAEHQRVRAGEMDGMGGMMDGGGMHSGSGTFTCEPP